MIQSQICVSNMEGWEYIEGEARKYAISVSQKRLWWF